MADTIISLEVLCLEHYFQVLSLSRQHVYNSLCRNELRIIIFMDISWQTINMLFSSSLTRILNGVQGLEVFQEEMLSTMLWKWWNNTLFNTRLKKKVNYMLLFFHRGITGLKFQLLTNVFKLPDFIICLKMYWRVLPLCLQTCLSRWYNKFLGDRHSLPCVYQTYQGFPILPQPDI